ncbi:MAG: HAMP domain-containing sensor histidine kinase [Planctomycetota bacterium]
MTRRTALLLVVGTAALAVSWAWLLADYRRRATSRRESHRHLVETMLSAVDGALFRDCRGGRYDPAELTSSLEALREKTGAKWLAVVVENGGSLGTAGVPPGARDPAERVTREFLPPRPRGGGRGQHRPGANLVAVPEVGLELVMDYPRDRLDAEIADEFHRMLQVGIGVTAACLLAALLVGFRLRAAALRERLAASREQVRALNYLARLGAGLVHETKNPLGVVRGFAERMDTTDLPEPERSKAVRAILSETDRAVTRLDEFLLLSRPSELRKTEFPLDDLLAELAELLGPDLDTRVATFDHDGVSGVVSADREQIRRLLLNLLLNSVASLDPGGKIEARTETTRTGLRLIVADNGSGVPPGLRETLFEPYVSGRPGGTGLGLSIARRIALDHGFRLEYEPRDGGGSRFRLEIPES